ncbi:diguanylate cyclase [Pararobbsia alpina]
MQFVSTRTPSMKGIHSRPRRISGAVGTLIAAQRGNRLAGVANYLYARPGLVGITGTVVALAMMGLSLVTLYNGRTDALAHSRETSENLVGVISNDVARNMEVYDLSLQAMVDGAFAQGVKALPPLVRRQVVFDRATHAGYLSGAFVFNPDGQAVLDRDSDVARSLNASDREFFIHHKNDPSTATFISHPFQSRVQNAGPTITMSRRIDRADGSFAGVASIGLRIELFRSLLDRVSTGEHGSTFIVRRDGTMVVRKPYSPKDIGASIAWSPTFGVMASHDHGTYAARAAVDGVRRIYTFARIPNTPFIAVVAPAEEDVLAPWRRRTLVVGGLTLLFGLTFIGLAWALVGMMRQHVATQMELARLAGTDGLTGLLNRRAFDLRVGDAWAHARRERLPLSALFVDIDFFKLFNDAYGHAVGDDALVAVSDCIEASIRKPGDIAARYGGEEFVVVLPATGSDGALAIAERLRERVAAAGIAHEAGVVEVLTVSIGCATAFPAEGSDIVELLAAADRALYQAKSAGRNRVTVVELPFDEVRSSTDSNTDSSAHA